MPENEKRVALITGGAKRVGRAVVEHLAAAGYDIAFTWLSSEAEASSLAEQIRAMGQRCLSIRADLTDPLAASQAISGLFSTQFDRLDVLVNNASLYLPGRLADVNVDDARRMWAIHVESPMLLAKVFAPLLRASHGHIVNMVDVLAERPWPQYLAYSTTKAALLNLTLGLARELAPEVTVNGIAPGVVKWPDNYPQAEQKKYLQRVPLDRPGTPQDVAQTVLFLATPGSYLTGQILRLDGGRLLT